MKDKYNNIWFPSGSKGIQRETDAYITATFSTLLDRALRDEFSVLQESKRAALALIIVLDQFSRHVFRFREEPSDSKHRSDADQRALRLCELLITDKESAWDCGFSVSEFVFALMPLRHSATIDRLEYILTEIDRRKSTVTAEADLLHKFQKQTFRRLQHLQDRAAAAAADSILERTAFDASHLEYEMLSHPVVKSTDAFLQKHLAGRDTSNLYISLSGGVDSMVISKILVLLRRHQVHNKSAANYQIGNIVAAHIDYANRSESQEEASFVEDWCTHTVENFSSSPQQVCLENTGIIFRKRVIDEVTRGVTERSDYEKISREVRYNFYKTIMQEFGSPTADDIITKQGKVAALQTGVGIIFGHHKGDVQENVISNVMRGLSPLALSGMSEVSITNGVLIWRPLLAYTKNDIYDFAHKYGVPYLRDTTPSWSTRGKLRNLLVPLLIDIYGEGCLRNLASLAEASDEASVLVSMNIYEPFLKSVRRYPCGLVVNVLPFRHQPHSFWREMLKELMHSMDMALVRDAAVSNFKERIERFDSKESHQKVAGWLELRKGFYTYLSEDGDLFIFRGGTLSCIEKKRQQYSQQLDSPLCSSTLKVSKRHTESEEVNIYKLVSVPAAAISDELFRTTDDGYTRFCLLPEPTLVVLRGWEIDISIVPEETSCTNKIDSLSKSCLQLLSGHFEYSIRLEPECTSLLSLLSDIPGCQCLVEEAPEIQQPRIQTTIARDFLEPGVYRCETFRTLVPFANLGFDKRIQDGLPLFQAISLKKKEGSEDNHVTATTDVSKGGSQLVRFLKLKYRYVSS